MRTQRPFRFFFVAILGIIVPFLLLLPAFSVGESPLERAGFVREPGQAATTPVVGELACCSRGPQDHNLVGYDNRGVGNETVELRSTGAASKLPYGTGAASAQEMVVVPAGTVETGADPFGSAMNSESVLVDTFLIAKTEVTNAAFAEFVRASGYLTLAEQRGEARTWRTHARPETGTHPVTYIAWADANAYCEHAGLRLPTELEWERAARGDDARLWPWGNVWDGGNLNSLERGAAGPSPVGSFPQGASPYGPLDLAGNVWEWTASSYLTDAQPSMPDAVATQSFEGHRVLRGGSWRTMAPGTQATYRKPAPLDYWRDTTGFRCAGDLPP